MDSFFFFESIVSTLVGQVHLLVGLIQLGSRPSKGSSQSVAMDSSLCLFDYRWTPPLVWEAARSVPHCISNTWHRVGSLIVEYVNTQMIPKLLQLTFLPSGGPQPLPGLGARGTRPSEHGGQVQRPAERWHGG